MSNTTTRLPPACGEPLSRIYGHDDEEIDWDVIEAQGAAFVERSDQQMADTVRPGGRSR